MTESKWKRWWWIPALLGGAILAHAIWTWTWQSRYEERLAALRAAGEPLDASEIAWPEVPDAQNAAIPFAEAAAWYAEHLEEGDAVLDEWPAVRDIPPPALEEERAEARARLRAWLDEGTPYVALLREAAARPSWHEDLDGEADPDMVRETNWRVLDAARFLEQRVRQAPQFTPEVLDELTILAGLSTRAPLQCVIGRLVKWSAQGVVYNLLKDATRLSGFDAEQVWNALHGYLRRVPSDESIRRAWREERLMGIGVLRSMIDGADGDDGTGDPLEGERRSVFNWHYRGWLYRDGIQYLDLMDAAIGLASEPPLEAKVRAAGLATQGDLWSARVDPENFSSGLGMLPGMFYGQRLEIIARQRVALVGLALLVVKARTGAWPETLDGVVSLTGPEAIVDPYKGEPLIWEPGVRLEARKPVEDRELAQEFNDPILWRFDDVR